MSGTRLLSSALKRVILTAFGETQTGAHQAKQLTYEEMTMVKKKTAVRKPAVTGKRKAATAVRKPKKAAKKPAAPRAAKKAAPAKMEKRSLAQPDESRAFDKGKLDVVTLGGLTFGVAVFQPGWRWSESVKPIVKTESCQAPHLSYHISGCLRVRMDDGSEEEFKAGDLSLLPPGHDAWVVGDEPAVVIDVSGMGNYAKA